MPRRYAWLRIILLCGCIGTASWAWAATYTVTSTADSGAGTFRQAVADAFTNPGPDVIEFSGGLGTITLTGSVTINSTVAINGQGAQIISGGGTASMLMNFSGSSHGSTLTGVALIQTAGTAVNLSSNCNRIYNCRIGTDFSDTAGLGNSGGVSVSGALNYIGGPSGAGEGNVISGNSSHGITCNNALAPVIQGNMIGVNSTGTALLANGGSGILLGGAVAGTRQALVGGDRALGLGNIISGNGIYGVHINTFQSVGNTLAGNLIGVSAMETNNFPNLIGVYVHSGGNWIGLPGAGYENVIAANTNEGVYIWDVGSGQRPRQNTIQNNFIGLASNGETGFANRTGILVRNADATLIGGDASAGCANTISFNTQNGVLLANAHGNTVSGNVIGMNASGSAVKANGDNGIAIQEGQGNLIGGSNASGQHGNLISGNANYGVSLNRGAAGQLIQGTRIYGNKIGVNSTGTAAMANGLSGILLGAGSSDTWVGGAAAGERNVVAGNGGAEIYLNVTAGNRIAGNYIGVGSDGTTVAGGRDGVILYASHNNLLGGTDVGAGNIIAGQGLGLTGIYMENSTGNTAVGNWIGVLADHAFGPSPALDYGIRLYGGSADNWIGLSSPLMGNLIAGVGYGVAIQSSTADRNQLYANTICAFATQGIQMAAGANDDKPVPAFAAFDGTHEVSGTSQASDVIEVFYSDRGAGVAGGSVRLAGRTTADGSGAWSLAIPGIQLGDVLCAQATGGSNTSGFSMNYLIQEPPTATPTATESPTFTATPTATLTASPTETFTATPTATPTASFTETSTATPTATPTASPTETPTTTPTATESPTPTITETVVLTATATSSITPEDSPTLTHTPELSGTPTATPTATATITATGTATLQATASMTATITETPVAQPTASVTLTLISTATPTPTLVVTPAATATPTPEATAAPATSTLTPAMQPGQPDRVLAFPNPAREQVRFLLPADVRGPVMVRIYNCSGELAALVAAEAGSVPVWDCRSVAPGIYIVQVMEGSRVVRTLKCAVVR